MSFTSTIIMFFISTNTILYMKTRISLFIIFVYTEESENHRPTRYGKPRWFDIVKTEYWACREAVCLVDMSSFAKLEIRVWFCYSNEHRTSKAFERGSFCIIHCHQSPISSLTRFKIIKSRVHRSHCNSWACLIYLFGCYRFRALFSSFHYCFHLGILILFPIWLQW